MDWQTKLQRLGVQKGERQLKSAEPLSLPTPNDTDTPSSPLFAHGREWENEVGTVYAIERVLPVAPCNDFAPLRPLMKENTPASADHCLFLDLETTGLAGAGSVPFLVGVAYTDPNANYVLLRQYFLRDLGEEAAVLHDLGRLMAERPHLITFNGRTFDLPLLQNRYRHHRHLALPHQQPHLDLLTVARKLWRSSHASLALSHLEKERLGITRTQEDVAGYLIPQLYYTYLRTREIDPLRRIFYHNQTDLLSMVALLQESCQFVQAERSERVAELWALARWYRENGHDLTAERILRQAVAQSSGLAEWQTSLHELATLLKQIGRRAEAAICWQQLAVTSENDVAAHLELAKYAEWQSGDLRQALRWTELAMAQIGRDHPSQAAWQHRQQRLQRKLAIIPPHASSLE